jgi:hypothetical protein
MNERIRQLAEQASEIDGDDLLYYHPVFAEKFAELIVQECASVLLKWKGEPFPFDEDLAASLVKEHFGVEQ